MSTVPTEANITNKHHELLQVVLELLEEVWEGETGAEEAHHFLLTHMRSRLLVFKGPKSSRNILDEFEGYRASTTRASAERRAQRIMECIRERRGQQT